MRQAIRKRFAQIAIFLLMMAAGLFGAAGRLDWVMAWLLLGVYAGGVAINAVLLLRRSPDLIEERARGLTGARRCDKVLGATAGLAGPLATCVVAGLDQRFRWSPQPPLAAEIAALAVLVAGYALLMWAMLSNRFFSAAARIQRDRGHVVVTAGPYRCVRHPGYAGVIALSLATPVMLGSAWALLPAAVAVAAVAARTVLEDRMLRRELEGYQEYAKRVRYRLLPGLW